MAASSRSPAEGEDSSLLTTCCHIQDYDAILPTVASDEEEEIVGMEDGNELTVGIAEAMVATAAALVPAMVASADMELIKRQSVCMYSFKAADSLVFSKPQKEKEKKIQLKRMCLHCASISVYLASSAWPWQASGPGRHGSQST